MTETITVIIVLLLIIVLFALMAIIDIRSVNKTIKDADTSTARYIYTILGKTPTNGVEFRYIESDTKLTYQEIKDKFPSTKIMSINVLDTKEGKF